MSFRDREHGQAAVELLATLPLLLAALLATAQLAIVGHALWSAAAAARAGARAAHVGGSAERAAQSALPSWLAGEVTTAAGGPVEVAVDAPSLLPGVPEIEVGAAAALDPSAGATGG